MGRCFGRRCSLFRILASAAALNAIFLNPALSQTVDHARIEELFRILATPNGVPEISIGQTRAPVPENAPAPVLPAPAPAPKVAAQQRKGDEIPSVPFAELAPDGSDCPVDLVAFKQTLEDMTEKVEGFEKRLIKLSVEFNDLDDENLAFMTSDSSSCPPNMRKKHALYLQQIQQLDIASSILPAENLQVCAQKEVTRLDARIMAIPEDASLDEQNMRNRIGRVMLSISSFDVKATNVVERMVSLEQKRGRLLASVLGFDSQCKAFDSITLGKDPYQ